MWDKKARDNWSANSDKRIIFGLKYKRGHFVKECIFNNDTNVYNYCLINRIPIPQHGAAREHYNYEWYDIAHCYKNICNNVKKWCVDNNKEKLDSNDYEIILTDWWNENYIQTSIETNATRHLLYGIVGMYWVQLK